jgi:tight adherence protein B
MIRRAALAVAALLVLAAPAAAASDVRVKGVDPSDYPTMHVSVVTTGALSQPPSLREDGQSVTGLQAENLGREKSVVLAVDTSRSMAGRALADAARAARGFVASKPGADRIAILKFGHKPVLLTTFSSSTIDAVSALRQISVDAREGTALYDAVSLAAQSLESEQNLGRVVILLTDGRDVSSRDTLKTAIKEARAAGVAIYPIGIVGKGFDPAPLQQLAQATGGSYYAAASTGALRSVYSSIATELSRTWRLSYETSARPGDHVHLQVTVAGLGSADARFTMKGSAAGVAKPSGLLPATAYTSPLGTLVLTLSVGFLLFLAAGLALASSKGAWLRSRIAAHVADPKRAAKLAAGAAERERFSAFASLFRVTEEAFGHLRHWRAVHRLLERADLPLRTVEFLYITMGSSLVVGLIAAVSGLKTILIALALVFGAALPFGVLWIRAIRRLKQIEDSLPDLLVTVAASLKAGHSFRQGIQNVVEEGEGPAAKEFKRVLTETRLGRPMDEALDEMADRVGSKNLEFVITAVTIQRQVGGSLAGLFDMVAEAVRNRQQFARKIKSLTAMGRMSAYVLCGLPFFMAGILTVINPNYMSPLYHTSAGHKLVIVALVQMLIGSLLLKKIVSFKG